MAKKRIFTVGFDLPGDEFEYVDFDSDATLLDADVVLFEPTLGSARGYESYNGKMLLDEYSSFNVKQRLVHWRSEIFAAIKAGKLVIVYLAKPKECYRHTGEKQHSGTGRSRVTTNIVTQVSSYEAIPNLKAVNPKSGTEIRLDREAKYLGPYWEEFKSSSPYEVEVEGEFSKVLLRSRDGDRTLGAAVHSSTGVLLFLPPLRYDESSFVKPDKDGDESWSKGALQFGKRLVASVSALADALLKSGDATPPPNWAAESKFRMTSEARLESEISECSSKISQLQERKVSLQEELVQAGSLRGLLFEQGKQLEAAVMEALRLIGFDAQPFADGESEFDCVFSSPEGRCLGEAEGKDSKPINIDKLSQLERNIQEDFALDHVAEYAKGVLFGNAFRLLPLENRAEFFTDKCVSAARRAKAALIRTPDLFGPARYMKENPADGEYAVRCRIEIFRSEGELVVFPPTPTAGVNIVEARPQSVEAKPNIQANTDPLGGGGES